jgi:undecaprenyl-diphosphatase
MDGGQAILLGIVEGVTEFLPVSSTGHLTIVEKLMNLPIRDEGVTAFTAIIQLGAIAAAIIYFRKDIARLVLGFINGLISESVRRGPDFREALMVIGGTVPIAVVGLAAKHAIEGPFRRMSVIAVALIAWSAVMYYAERVADKRRGESELTWTDTMVIGVAQCFALVPGVSRSGATISAGLIRGLDRVTATRISFLLAIPALTAAGALEAVTKASNVSQAVGWGPTLLATAVSFVIAYASIAWLLRLVAGHPITVFIGYRVVLGLLILDVLVVRALS